MALGAILPILDLLSADLVRQPNDSNRTIASLRRKRNKYFLNLGRGQEWLQKNCYNKESQAHLWYLRQTHTS